MNTVYNIQDIGGDVVKRDSRYVVRDNTELSSLVLSSTLLHQGKSTTGHSHPGQEEVYFFVSGNGKMQIDDNTFMVDAGSMVLVPDGAFHRVYNAGLEDLYFVCVFNGDRASKHQGK